MARRARTRGKVCEEKMMHEGFDLMAMMTMSPPRPEQRLEWLMRHFIIIQATCSARLHQRQRRSHDVPTLHYASRPSIATFEPFSFSITHSTAQETTHIQMMTGLRRFPCSGCEGFLRTKNRTKAAHRAGSRCCRRVRVRAALVPRVRSKTYCVWTGCGDVACHIAWRGAGNWLCAVGGSVI